jgi:hypothetical protein
MLQRLMTAFLFTVVCWAMWWNLGGGRRCGFGCGLPIRGSQATVLAGTGREGD